MPFYNSIVGIDCSLTNTGLAAIRHKNDKWVSSGTYGTSLIAKKFTDPLRQVAITDLTRGFLRVWKPEAVVVEDYAFAGIGMRKLQIAELVGMLKHLILVEFGLPTYLVAPLSLKKFMDCADKAKRGDKDAMFAAASRKFQFVSSDNDIVDAYCLARYLAANKEGQILPIVRLDPLPHYRIVPVQVPAPKKVAIMTKNRLLTIGAARPTLKAYRRIR